MCAAGSPPRAAASGRLRADRARAFTDQYSKQGDSFIIWFISIKNAFFLKYYIYLKVITINQYYHNISPTSTFCSSLDFLKLINNWSISISPLLPLSQNNIIRINIFLYVLYIIPLLPYILSLDSPLEFHALQLRRK